MKHYGILLATLSLVLLSVAACGKSKEQDTSCLTDCAARSRACSRKAIDLKLPSTKHCSRLMDSCMKNCQAHQ